MGEWYGKLTHLCHTKVHALLQEGLGVPCPLPDQYFSCLPAIGYVPAI